MSDEGSPVLLHVLERLLSDRDRGELLDLESYQRLCPGFEQQVAEQYAQLGSAGEGPSEGDSLRRVGRYRLLEELGRGGQGVVYRAVDDELGRPVALKLLTGLNALGEGALRRFLREARAASRLNHPGICPIYERGEDDGVPFLAMAFVEGRSLADILVDREGSPPPTGEEIDEFLETFQRLAETLHAAHEAGIVHRDIKPANLLIVPGAHPVVLDFGIAQILEDDEGLTLTGQVLGTPAYMSPEQISAQAIAIDRRTDVYSLAVSLYETLTLRRPFAAPTREGLYRQIVSDAAPDPGRLNRNLPADVRTVLQTAMRKDPDDRYLSAASFAEDLGRARRREPILAKPPGLLRRAGKWARRNPAWTISLVIMAALLGVGTTLSVNLARQTEVALFDRERMADSWRLDELFAQSHDSLWPALPEKVPAYEAWFADVEALLARRDENRGALDALRARALPYSDADRAADREHYAHEYAALADSERLLATLLDQPDLWAQEDEYRKRILERVANRRTWSFTDPGSKLLHELLAEHAGRLFNIHAPVDAYPVTLTGMQARLELARSLGTRLIGEDAEAWERCVAELADPSTVYGALALEPTAGLVPLGRDRRSGLWEFWHVASGARPEWDGEPTGTGEVRLEANSGEEGLVLVLIPGGRFNMGAQAPGPEDGGQLNADPDATIDEVPVHSVALDPFLISKYEVSRGQWERLHPGSTAVSAVANENSTMRHPATSIDWDEASEACRRWALQLPTEAQWEFVCRAGTTTPYSTGAQASTLRGHANTIDSKRMIELGLDAAHVDDLYAFAAPVGALAPNPWGVHDTHGNAGEWCRDGYFVYGDWEHRDGDGMQGPLVELSHRVRRPGSFATPLKSLRSSARQKMVPDFAGVDYGFRPACRAPLRR